ncbi:hypothetical protein D3C76_1355690 [compost metagenome]
MVVNVHPALIESDSADVQHPVRRLSLIILGPEIKRPVGPAIGQAFEFGGGLVEIDARNDDLLKQQWQRRQAKLDTL